VAVPGDPTLVDITTRHTDAIEGLLTVAGHPLYVAEVTDDDATRVYPYLVLHPTPGTADFDDLAWSSANFAWSFQVTAVGRDRHETLAALNLAQALLVGVRPVVSGRSCGLISQPPGAQSVVRPDPTTRDPATMRPVFYAVAQFELTTYPA
jgi:hypothetical protein